MAESNKLSVRTNIGGATLVQIPENPGPGADKGAWKTYHTAWVDAYSTLLPAYTHALPLEYRELLLKVPNSTQRQIFKLKVDLGKKDKTCAAGKAGDLVMGKPGSAAFIDVCPHQLYILRKNVELVWDETQYAPEETAVEEPPKRKRVRKKKQVKKTTPPPIIAENEETQKTSPLGWKVVTDE